MQIANGMIQQEITAAMVQGFQLYYGDQLGALYGDVLRYRAGSLLDPATLRQELDTEAVPVLRAIVRNQVEPPTLHAIRSLMIGCAIAGDRDAVLRWANEGLNRARQADGEWTQTLPQWEAVQRDPGHFVLYARQIKFFLMQI